ncbi:hypothetical protein [Roseitranquillus sediminis]|uniref:hypothetical protein n=1 Tax=Roseitranquillus sediminis TaxID=2809051 RepID=UPI001D0CAAF7|nr:hypothetical protein [Roseitranquillus sediminis]MBM9594891.1 hypothetical protein [Roseitranquillus sediminis]
MRAKEDLVERISHAGEDWLFYRALPFHVALIRATTEDETGNLGMERGRPPSSGSRSAAPSPRARCFARCARRETG